MRPFTQRWFFFFMVGVLSMAPLWFEPPIPRWAVLFSLFGSVVALGALTLAPLIPRLRDWMLDEYV